MPKQTYSLAEKVVLVTGAGSGLGEATVRAFADEECSVACIDLDPSAIKRVNADIKRQGTRSLAITCDVSSAESVQSAVQAVVDQFGRLDILVNCAAIDHTLSVEEMSIEQWDQVINVNLRGPFLLAKAAWPFFKQQHSGHIVNIASTAALRSWANASAYHASKRGVIGFGQGLSVEGRPYGIRVTTIIPGGMNTHFFDRFAQQDIPMPDPQHLQDPAIVAATIVHAAHVPPTSAIQEVLITPMTETSWP
ncbi:SDR family oxidoreductase [Dictyobacter aurantiacus]|uniref:Short-chain dehydrogenase n=1 Tax=Dictyobacter aurantiacus TaxID=1936993 RepID=A0A401Z7E6_9CHLR|nr:SDR family oxidoreductase [Dictyobacter aurantiacus]GCE02755.1 short-chain dehydrogenase [Dictyobacter aurantiacus]